MSLDGHFIISMAADIATVSCSLIYEVLGNCRNLVYDLYR